VWNVREYAPSETMLSSPISIGGFTFLTEGVIALENKSDI